MNVRSSKDRIPTGIDLETGYVVVIRPDQYIGHILPLDAYDEVSTFFAAFMIDTDN